MSERNTKLKIAVQKTGRLADKTLSLLGKCGLDFDLRRDRLIQECQDFPAELMLVRDDDIPEYVTDGVCHLGVIGENVLEEKGLGLERLARLGFGHCRLVVAVREEDGHGSLEDLSGLRIATSYPACLLRFLRRHDLSAQVVELSGSVEIAPALGIADAVCDLVSTGGTLRANGLRELVTIFESQAVLVRRAGPLTETLELDVHRLLQRIQGVTRAAHSKYVMMNAPRESLAEIRRIIPGMEEPSVMPLGLDGQRVAIHAVAREPVFWETLENLKTLGASSILVLPIEKVIE